MTTLGLLQRHDLETLARTLHGRAVNVNKHVEDNYLLARPFEERAPAGQALNKEREVIMRMLEARQVPSYILDPGDWPRTIWDGAASILIIADMFYIPFMIAFFSSTSCPYLWPGNPHPATYLTHRLTVGWRVYPMCVTAFFLVDILLNCFTAYTKKEVHQGMEVRLPHIWRHYAMTWMAIDVVACLPLQCLLSGVAGGVSNVGYLLGLVRVPGLRRRSQGHPLAWVDHVAVNLGINSLYTRRTAEMSLFCLLLLHYFVCLEWLALRLQGPNPGSWAEENQISVVDGNVLEQYLWGLFNSISAMIMLTYGSYPPFSWSEALVWCFLAVAVAGAFMLITLLIVAMIVEGSTWRVLFRTRMDDVMRALDRRYMPPSLRKQILKHYGFKLESQVHRTLDNAPKLYDTLPDELAMEVAVAVCEDMLLSIRLLTEMPELLGPTARLVVSRPAHFTAGDIISRQGWPASQVFFVREGLVDLLMDGIFVDTLGPGHHVGDDALLPLPSEAQLQAEGIRRKDVSRFTDCFTSLATVRALTNCSGFVLGAEEFRDLVQDYPAAERWLEAAALRYVREMRASRVRLGLQRRDGEFELLQADAVPLSRPTVQMARTSLQDLFRVSDKNIQVAPQLPKVTE